MKMMIDSHDRPQDRRVRRTQKLLATALIELTLEKGYEIVTVRDITDRADVGYATFFRHYHDKADLLQDVVEVVFEALTTRFFLAHPSEDPAVVGVILFEYVQEHSEIVRVLVQSPSLIKQLVEIVVPQMQREQKPQPDSIIPFEIAANHVITATISLIQWWLAHDMPYSPERMGAVYLELIAKPTNTATFTA